MTTVTPTNGGASYSVGSNQVNLGTQNSPNVVNSGSTPSTPPAPSNPQPQGNSNVNAQGTYTGYIAPNQVNVGTAQHPDIRTSGGTTAPNTGNQNTNQGTQNYTPQQQVQNFQNGLDTQYQQTSQKISDIQNGVIPLTPGEQAQIQGLQQQFQTLIQNQQLTNTNASGVANIRGYQTGAAEYDPSFQAKTIGSIVSAGQSKIADLNIKMASAVAALTQSFHDNDIKNVKDAWDMYSSYATERANQIQKTIDDATAAAKDARDYAEKQREFNLDYALKKQISNPGSPGTTPTVSMTGSGVPNSADQQKFLSAFSPLQQSQIKGLADYSINPASFSTSAKQANGGLSRSQAIALAKQYDPTFDENQYAARTSYLKNIQSGTLSQAVTSANKAISHLSAFAQSTMDLHNGTTSTTLNPIGQGIKSVFSSSYQKHLAEAKTEASGVKEELTKFFKGTGGTDVGSLNEWENNINAHLTPGQLQGSVQGAINLMSGQIDALTQQYVNVMGHPPANSFLEPRAIQDLSNLKNQGYEVNIPGVYYTDKDAYIKSDPDAVGNMKTAYQILQAQGLPTTPDNILQGAQQL